MAASGSDLIDSSSNQLLYIGPATLTRTTATAPSRGPFAVSFFGHWPKKREKQILNTDTLKEFIPGTKVSLKNEFGVVLEKTSDNDLVGLIRWDTEKENDVEDWRGLLGTFLQSGGQVADQDYKFKFIDDKGQLKKASR